MPRSRDRRRERHLEYLRAQGLAGFVPAGPVRDRLRFLHDRRGITFDRLAEKIGLDRETILMQYRGTNKTGARIKSCEMKTERLVLGARFTREDMAWAPALGVRRRLQALYAVGYTGPFLAERLPTANYQILHNTMSGKKSRGLVKAEFADAVSLLYDKLYDTDPVEAGVLAQASSRARTYAARHQYAPPSCWDSDTLDDPEAIPEWTGKCGTVWGVRIHETEGIPLCPPCAGARGATDVELSGPKLLAARLRRGWSQERVAQESGIKVDQYRSWERGRTKPRYPEQLDRVMAVLDVTFDEVAE